ncbi:hypothetical protein FQA39_LY18619 [Lamprigera yunnana]|nr:hypothetical protein FQA39_LY18619 [Lamprigera yunnana]
MESKLTKTIGTAQGSSEAPVPARGEGSVAGPPGSLSDDCQAREVGDQAYALGKNSGIGRQETSSELENVINPFARRDSLTRTPPKAGADMPREEMAKEEPSPKKVEKRKVSDSPQIVFQAAQEEELVKYGKANKNVHVEVKKVANDLNMLINRAIGRDRRRISEIVSKQAIEQQEEITVIKETKKMATLTYWGEEGRKLERINKGMMEREKGFQNFAKLNEEKEWPRKVFKCVKFAGGNRERWKRERNVICVIGSEKGEEECRDDAKRMNEKGESLIKLLQSDIIGEGVVGSESEVRVIGLIRAKETQQNENGKTMYGCVEDMINKLGALGIKEAGVRGYGVEVPDIVARTLEYHSRGKNFSSVLYGEGDIEDKGGMDRAITRDTMFVKLREGQSYADTMKKLRKEVDVRDTGVRVMEVKNVRDKEIAIRFTERVEGGNGKMREKVARCLETEEIKMASERTGD